MKEFLQQWLPSLTVIVSSLTVIVSVWLGYRLTGRAMIQAARQSDERARKDRLVMLRHQWLMRFRLTLAELLASLREFRRLRDQRDAFRGDGLDVTPAIERAEQEIQRLAFQIPLLRLEVGLLLEPGNNPHDALWQQIQALNVRADAGDLIPAVEELERLSRGLVQQEWQEIHQMAQ
jgi:hypothetical protein